MSRHDRTPAEGEGSAAEYPPHVVLKPRKARPFFGRHPWVLDSAIARVEGTAADGDVADLTTDRGEWIARGLYNSQSRIRVRLFTWSESEALDHVFWRQRLETALQLRRQLGYDDRRGATRLVYSEADGLSGLVVERYGDYLVVQLTAMAIALRLGEILPHLVDLAQPRGVTCRTERDLAKLEGLQITEGPIWGTLPEGPVAIEEHGLRYGVDLASGQKTGFYLDQRENRLAAARYVTGRRVLDVCCYSGGFSLCAVKLGNAREAWGIDASQTAIAQARANAELNHASNVRFEVGDCFRTLDEILAAGKRFGAIVLDPPKFAHGRQAVEEALKAYHRLNQTAVELLEPNGILVSCSCSGHVNREDFLYMLAGVAQRTGREIQILEQRGAAADHPIRATCLESEYLKVFICRVT